MDKSNLKKNGHVKRFTSLLSVSFCFAPVKMIYLQQQKVKLSLFSDDMLWYIRDPKIPPENSSNDQQCHRNGRI